MSTTKLYLLCFLETLVGGEEHLPSRIWGIKAEQGESEGGRVGLREQLLQRSGWSMDDEDLNLGPARLTLQASGGQGWLGV